MKLLAWGLSIVFLALVIHIAVILWVPHLGNDQAFAVLWEKSEHSSGLFRIDSEDDLEPAQIPFTDPYLTVATCRFDLRQAAWSVSAEALAPYWSFSIHRSNGVLHYALTQASIRENMLKVELRNASQVRSRMLDPDSATADIVQVEMPFDEGLVLFSALSPVASMKQGVVDSVDALGCSAIGTPTATRAPDQAG